MTTEKNNSAAAELWDQVFSNLAKQENASLMDPEYNPAEDEAKLRQGLKDAGWSDAEVEARIEVHNTNFSAAPVTSPGVNPHVEFLFDRLCADVEAAMERLHLESQARIARGVEPRLGPYAAKLGVIMTEESIITVGSHMFRFCGLIARAFTRTLQSNPWLWEDNSYDETKGRDCIRRAPELLHYWIRIYLSYALTGTNIIVPFHPANKSEALHFEQVARAMEIFAIAHEYGHHNFAHGRQIEHDAHAEEFEADQFALRLCYEVEKRPLVMPNPYLSSGAGGVVLLMALRTLSTVKTMLDVPVVRGSDTHPDVVLRAERFDSVAILKPDEFKALKGFRVASSRIMAAVEAELTTFFTALPPETLLAIEPLRVGVE